VAGEEITATNELASVAVAHPHGVPSGTSFSLAPPSATSSAVRIDRIRVVIGSLERAPA
jgi:hypothetical protein